VEAEDKALVVEVEEVDMQQVLTDVAFVRTAVSKLPIRLVRHVMNKNALNAEPL
jgi:hypothetical protein